jgi:hypothetical protein
MSEIKVVWTDRTVKIYSEVISADADDRGQLVISFMEEIPPPHPSGRVRHNQRTVRIPLANVRWWGQRGKEVAW